MAYEVFNYQRGKHMNPRKTLPFVSVDKGSRIRLNKPCVEYLGRAEYVLLLLDREKGMVALKKAEKGGNAYRLTRHRDGSQAHVSVRRFLSQLGVSDQSRIPARLGEDMVQFTLPMKIEPLDT